ncbi:MAG TPA: NBR1-Ig-like domain-containing protein [Anaerolineales bacterium]|nr:NBR1-Ig-like domain-containing protein [Anaerolineales bacterium]
MKTIFRSSLTLLFVFLISACGGNGTPTEGVALSNVYTAAASTLAAQEALVTQTITATVPATQTSLSFPTSAPVTVTPATQNTVSYASASTANGCNDALFISDVTIADGTVLAPGEAFTKTWRFQNTGTCDWDEDYVIVFTSGTSMDGETTEIDQDVAVNATGDISVSLVAPESEGTYTGYWRLADGEGNALGQSVYVMIVVSDDASTVTPTPTITTEAEEEATSTPTVTTTPFPTATSTTVPADTDTPAPTASE